MLKRGLISYKRASSRFGYSSEAKAQVESFQNINLFKDESTGFLLKAAAVYKMCQSKFFIRNCDSLMSLSKTVLGGET